MAFKVGGKLSSPPPSSVGQKDLFGGSPSRPSSAPSLPPRVAGPARPGFAPRPSMPAVSARPPMAAPRTPPTTARPSTRGGVAADHGWTSPPPALGRPYRDFIEWACDQHMSYEDAEKLALDIVTGVIKCDEEDAYPAPRR